MVCFVILCIGWTVGRFHQHWKQWDMVVEVPAQTSWRESGGLQEAGETPPREAFAWCNRRSSAVIAR
jgi:hypothetical protein